MSSSAELIVKRDPEDVPNSHPELFRPTSDASVATVPVKILPICTLPGGFPEPESGHAQPPSAPELPLPLVSNVEVTSDPKVISEVETVPKVKVASDIEAIPNIKVVSNKVSQAKCDKFCSFQYFGLGFVAALFLVNSEFARVCILTVMFSGQYMIVTVLEMILYVNDLIMYTGIAVAESTFGRDCFCSLEMVA
ncbi:hypothetical protein FRC12_005534 [Ceratobasidium sp. 428]|nr:hypothetical protein FRC12_005534 [Ceratobasidium sp. 428]